SCGCARRSRLLRRPTRRCYGETRRRQHDDAREPGAGSTRGGSRGVGTTRSRAGGTVIRVLIVAPRSRRRRQLEHVVAQDPGLLLVAVSDAFESLNDVIDECRPDVIVLDPGPESHLPLPMLLEQQPTRDTTPFVVLLEDLAGEAGARALRAGARAALPRTAAPDELRAAVRAAAAGLASLPAALARAGRVGGLVVLRSDRERLTVDPVRQLHQKAVVGPEGEQIASVAAEAPGPFHRVRALAPLTPHHEQRRAGPVLPAEHDIRPELLE